MSSALVACEIPAAAGEGLPGAAPVAIFARGAFGEEGASFVRGWLRGPAGPLVETSWRVDTGGGRLLVRVDQLQRVVPGTVAAYGFTLPIRVVTEDGREVVRPLAVVRRKELFQVPIDGEPVSVEFDPEGTLVGLVKLRPARDS